MKQSRVCVRRLLEFDGRGTTRARVGEGAWSGLRGVVAIHAIDFVSFGGEVENHVDARGAMSVGGPPYLQGFPWPAFEDTLGLGGHHEGVATGGVAEEHLRGNIPDHEE